MIDAKTVIENMNSYHQMSLLLAMAAVIFMVISVVLWHKLKVKDAIRVLTGLGSGKAVARLKSEAEKFGIHKTGKFKKIEPVITWSKITGKTADNDGTTLIDERMSLSATMDMNMNIDLRINKSATEGLFIVEQDIVYTGMPTIINA